MPDTDPTRILDAAANRVSEGLRVVEDYLRFVLEDAHLTGQLKQLRHTLAATCTQLLGEDRCAARDTPHDVGTNLSTPSENRRADTWDVCVANLERSKQSLRSLEEFSKVRSPESASQLEALRYRLYTLEQAILLATQSRERLDGVTLCVLVDGQAPDFARRVTGLVAAGVGMIQLRDKGLADRELAERAQQLVALTRPHPTLAILNDRADIAVAAGADGVHLGQDDLSARDARRLLGPRKLIGVSTHSIEQARTAVLEGANYLGAGPTFPSTTKSFDAFPGLDYLRQVANEITLPTFAIGGICAENLPEVLATGIDRVAVSSAGPSASALLELLQQNQTP
jgi:thiamine-phosphate pyrophosphorylase